MNETVPVASCPEGCMSRGGIIGDRCHCGAKLDVREMSFDAWTVTNGAMPAYVKRAIYTPPPRALGWASPWSGDENTPRPPSYWTWFRLYTATRKLGHLLGIHCWDYELTHPPRRRKCTWCGRRA